MRLRYFFFWMLIVALLGGLGHSPSFAESKVGADQDNIQELIYTHTANFSKESLSLDVDKGFDVVRMSGAHYPGEAGQPDLPAIQVRIALPEGMAFKNLKIISTESEIIPGQYRIIPVQPPQKVGFEEAPVWVEPDPITYTSDLPYPRQPAERLGQCDLAGQNMAIVRVHPLTYSPKSGLLLFHQSIQFELQGKKGYICGDSLSNKISPQSRSLYEKQVKGMVVNPDDVELIEGSPTPKSKKFPPGNYDYIVISSTEWLSHFEPLVDWKTRKGVRAGLTSTNWIYSQLDYYGLENHEKIREFIIDAYNMWGTIYFLLGGDVDTIPVVDKELMYGRIIPCDTYYSDFDDDWVCEVHVGRASVESVEDIDLFIDKVLRYEQTPTTNDFVETNLMLGFDLSAGGLEGEGCKTIIHNDCIPTGWVVDSEYDSEPGPHRDDAVAYFDVGYHLVNHIDHCEPYGLGMGYTNHGQGAAKVMKPHVDTLTNQNRESIFYTIGCSTTAIDSTESCITEYMMRHDTGGTVAVIGNTREGWYLHGQFDQRSLRYDIFFFDSLFNQYIRNLGACFSDHKNDAYFYDDHMQRIFTTLTLLGDPEMPVWTEEPGTMTVTHPETVPLGTSTITVQVDFGGSPAFPTSLVCIHKTKDNIYDKQYTDPDGIATFNISPNSEGPINVTVTWPNYIPYLGTIEVLDVNRRKGPYLIWPGDNTEMTVHWQLDGTVDCLFEWGTDPLNMPSSVITSEYGYDHQHSYTIRNLNPGTKYYYRVTMNGSVYDGSFYAAPASASNGIKFIAYGDTRSFPSTHDTVADAIIDSFTQDPGFQSVLLSMSDLVNQGTIEADWDNQFFDAAYPNIQTMLANIPYHSCKGNHEGYGGGDDLFYKYFPYPYVDAHYWSFDYGPAHFVVVDQYVDYSPGSAQYAWLEYDLANTTKEWKFIYLHEPGWSAGGHANNTDVQDYIQPLCQQYDVPFVFAGHNHYYARAYVDGIHHITTGGGGAPLGYPDPGAENIVTCARANHYCKIKIARGILYLTVVEPDGTVIDSLTYRPVSIAPGF